MGINVQDVSLNAVKPELPQTNLEKYGFYICTAIMVGVGIIGGLAFKDDSIPQPWSSVSNVSFTESCFYLSLSSFSPVSPS